MKHVTDRGGMWVNFDIEPQTGELIARGVRREFINGEDRKTKIVLAYRVPHEMLEDLFDIGGHEAASSLLCAVVDTICETILRPDAFEILPHIGIGEPSQIHNLESTFLAGGGHSDEYADVFTNWTERASFSFRNRSYTLCSMNEHIKVVVSELAA